jgi:hypothetical protein
MERGVRVLAWLYGLAAGAGLVLGAPLVLLLAAADPRRRHSGDSVGALLVLAAIFLLLPAILGAVGTLRGRRWGPIALGYVATLLVFLFPVGTVVGGLSLWVLFPALKRGWAQQRDANAAAAAWHATPCDHLRPCLSEMHRRGIRLRVAPQGRVSADCTIDLLALARWRGALDPLVLSMPAPDQRKPPGPRQALLWCKSCNCGMSVVAPGTTPLTVPIFPGPAA